MIDTVGGGVGQAIDVVGGTVSTGINELRNAAGQAKTWSEQQLTALEQAGLFLSGGLNAEQWVKKFLKEGLKALKTSLQHGPNMNVCGMDIPNAAAGQPGGTCVQTATQVANRIASAGQLIQAGPLLQAMVQLVSDARLFRAIFGLIGKVVADNLGRLFSNPSELISASLYLKTQLSVMKLFTTFWMKHTKSTIMTLIPNFQEVITKVLHPMKGTLEMVAAGMKAVSGSVFDGKHWYVAACVSGSYDAIGIGGCIYVPVGWEDNQLVVKPREIVFGLGPALEYSAGPGGAATVLMGPVLTNNFEDLTGLAIGAGLNTAIGNTGLAFSIGGTVAVETGNQAENWIPKKLVSMDFGLEVPVPDVSPSPFLGIEYALSVANI